MSQMAALVPQKGGVETLSESLDFANLHPGSLIFWSWWGLGAQYVQVSISGLVFAG